MWQWDSGTPRPRLRSRLFDGCTKAGERIAQNWIGDVIEIGGQPCRGFAVEGGRGRPTLAAERRLPQPQTRNRTPAEEAVDPLQNDRREVLDLKRRGALDPQHQRAGLGNLAIPWAWPLNFFGLGMACDLRAHDIGPAGDKLRRGKALFGEGVVERPVHKIGEWTRVGFAGLVHSTQLCEGSHHEASSRNAAAKARHPAFGPARG